MMLRSKPTPWARVMAHYKEGLVFDYYGISMTVLYCVGGYYRFGEYYTDDMKAEYIDKNGVIRHHKFGPNRAQFLLHLAGLTTQIPTHEEDTPRGPNRQTHS